MEVGLRAAAIAAGVTGHRFKPFGLIARNFGDRTARQVVVTIDLTSVAGRLELVPLKSGGCPEHRSRIVCRLGDIPAESPDRWYGDIPLRVVSGTHAGQARLTMTEHSRGYPVRETRQVIWIVPDGPDLQVTGGTPTRTKPGGTATVPALVRNYGSEATASFEIEFRADGQYRRLTGDSKACGKPSYHRGRLGEDGDPEYPYAAIVCRHGSLRPGQAGEVRVTVKIAADMPRQSPGPYLAVDLRHVRVSIAGDADRDDADEADNRGVAGLEVTGVHNDLAPVGRQVPSQEKGILLAQIGIVNHGPADEDPYNPDVGENFLTISLPRGVELARYTCTRLAGPGRYRCAIPGTAAAGITQMNFFRFKLSPGVAGNARVTVTRHGHRDDNPDNDTVAFWLRT